MKFGSVVLLITGLLLASCTQPAKPPAPRDLNVGYWRTYKDGKPIQDFVYPEKYLLPELANKEDLGIAISGGGSESAVAAVGEVRALKNLGILDRARYLCTNSGGTYFSAPFTYARPELASDPYLKQLSQEDYDKVFLGCYVPPGNLTLAHLGEKKPGSFIWAVDNINPSWAVFGEGLGSETIVRVLSDMFLTPFGLGDKNRSFTWSRSYQRNHIPADLGGVPDFYYSVPGRPFLIMNETLVFGLSTLGSNALDALREKFTNLRAKDRQNYWLVESTPLYTGLKVEKRRRPFGFFGPEKAVGGGYVETYGYAAGYVSPACAGNGRRANVRTSYPAIYSLSDAMSASGDAPGVALGLQGKLLGITPIFHHWPVGEQDPSPLQGKYSHMDGGACDNTGVVPLLARGVSRIIVFANVMETFPLDAAHGCLRAQDICTDITALFGRKGSSLILNTTGSYAFAQVLDPTLSDGCDALCDLAKALTDCNRSKRPLVVCREYTTVGNGRFGVAGGHRVKICWVYLTPAQLGDGKHFSKDQYTGTQLDAWISQLQPSVRNLFTNPDQIKSSKLAHFPNFNLLQENSKPQQLDPVQANALAQFTSFCVMQAAPEIERGLGLQKAARQ